LIFNEKAGQFSLYALKFTILANFTKPIYMSEKDIKKLQDLALEILKKGVTKEEALRTFVGAGILDEKGNFTKLHENLATLISK
jgi:hypothetical protein